MTDRSDVLAILAIIAGVVLGAATGLWLIGGTVALVGVVIHEFF